MGNINSSEIKPTPIIDTTNVINGLPSSTSEERDALFEIAKHEGITLPELKILQEKFKSDVETLSQKLQENCDIITLEARSELAKLGQECLSKIDTIRKGQYTKTDLSPLVNAKDINHESAENVKQMIIAALETGFIHNQGNDTYLGEINEELKKNGINNGLGVEIPNYNNSESQLRDGKIVNVENTNKVETTTQAVSVNTESTQSGAETIHVSPIENIISEIKTPKDYSINFNQASNIVNLEGKGHRAYFTYGAKENTELNSISSIQNWVNGKIDTWNTSDALKKEAGKATDILAKAQKEKGTSLSDKLQELKGQKQDESTDGSNIQTASSENIFQAPRAYAHTITIDENGNEIKDSENNIENPLGTFSEINGNTLNQAIDKGEAKVGDISLKYLKNSDRIRFTLGDVSFTLRVSELSEKQRRKTVYLIQENLQTKFKEKYNTALSEKNTEKAETELKEIERQVEKISITVSEFFVEPVQSHEQAWIDTLSGDEVTLDVKSVVKDAQNNTIITFDIDDSGLNDEINSDFIVNLEKKSFNEASFKEILKKLVHERIYKEPNREEIIVGYEEIKDALNVALQNPNQKQEIGEMYNQKITLEFDNILDGFYLKIGNNNSIHLSEISYNKKEITFPVDYVKNLLKSEVDKVISQNNSKIS